MTAVRQTGDPAEIAEALALRAAVFCDEQGVSVAEERDGRDDEATHLVVVEDGAVVGTCRLLPYPDPPAQALKLARMAVAARARGRGLAGLLLEEAERVARAGGVGRIVLDAQLTAVPVYARAGYAGEGDVFLDAGIEHRRMTKGVAA